MEEAGAAWRRGVEGWEYVLSDRKTTKPHAYLPELEPHDPFKTKSRPLVRGLRTVVRKGWDRAEVDSGHRGPRGSG